MVRVVSSPGWRPAALLALVVLASASAALEAVTISEHFTFPTSGGVEAVREPGAAVLLADGTLAIADPGARRVILRRPGGSHVALDVRPNALLADGMRLLVAEHHAVRQFQADGREGPVVADRTHADFSRISGLALDARGNLYASDDGRDVVFVLSPDGLLLNVVGRDADEPAALSNPAGVALDHRGSLYVADRGNRRVAVFSTGGVFRFAVPNSEDPVAVAVDAAGLVYVADRGACRVLRFDPTGRPLGAFGARGRSRGQFREIAGLSIDDSGTIRVTDASNRTLHALSWPSRHDPEPRVLPISAAWLGERSGALVALGPAGPGRVAVRLGEDVVIADSALRELGRLPRGLRDPVAAAADPEGRLYVVDRGAGEVKVFDRDLRELFGLGRGSRVLFFRGGDGKLVKPRAVAVSSRGLVAVADVDKVEIFGPDGTWLVRAGSEGEEPGQVEDPVAVAYDPAGNLFVADASNRRITVFDTSGAFSGNYFNDIRPLAMDVDAHGRVYVLEERGPRLRVFSGALAPLATVGSDERGRGGLRGAASIAIVEDRVILGRDRDAVLLDLDLPVPAPAGVRVEAGTRSLRLEWDTASSPLAASFLVEISGAVGTRTLALAPGDTVAGLEDEETYAVIVRGVNRLGGPGYPSRVVTAVIPALELPPPGAPRIVYAGEQARVVLQWEPSPTPYAAGYVVEGLRDRSWVRLAESRGSLAEIAAGSIRRYRVRAVAPNGRVGAPSEEGVHTAAEGLDALAAGQDALAAESLRRASEEESLNATVWRGLGEASERLERFPEAMAAYRRALDLAAADSFSSLGLARIAVLRGDSGLAASALHHAAGAGAAHFDPEVRYLRGQLAIMEGEYETAVRHLAAAVASVPSTRNRAALAEAEEKQRQFGENRPRLEFASAAIRPVFPALYKTYSGSPIGEAVVRNGGRLPLERVRFSVFIRGAMDFPSDTVLPRLLPGETIAVPIHAELSNGILEATEDDTKQAELRLTYYRAGEPVEVRTAVPFLLHARTALIWEDPARIAAFVTARAPVVSELARNVAALIADRLPPNGPLARAMALRRALQLHGLRYVEDPGRPYRLVSESAEAVDHVQLPEETLRNRAGDCDDLVVLMAALLENLAVRTAVIDLPGHVALLVNTELPPEAAAGLAPTGAIVERAGTAWVPLETTRTDGDWDDAVADAAALLERAGPAARIVEIGDAWRTYPPVTTQSSTWRAPLPEGRALLGFFDRDDRALRGRRAAALGAAYQGSSDPSARNRLAVIHARLGLLDEAAAFLEGLESAAAENNRGNIALLRGDRAAARAHYERARVLDPADPGVARNLEAAR